jgi:hypothetical protein
VPLAALGELRGTTRKALHQELKRRGHVDDALAAWLNPLEFDEGVDELVDALALRDNTVKPSSTRSGSTQMLKKRERRGNEWRSGGQPRARERRTERAAEKSPSSRAAR